MSDRKEYSNLKERRKLCTTQNHLKQKEFISHEEIQETLAFADANKNNVELIDSIIEKAKLKKGLTHREASVLLACEIPEKNEEVFCPCKEK